MTAQMKNLDQSIPVVGPVNFLHDAKTYLDQVNPLVSAHLKIVDI